MHPNRYQNTDADVNAYADPKSRVIFGFDRITIWLDHTELPISLCRLKKHCAQIEVFVEQMFYQARWKLRLEVFQPTDECIGLLIRSLGHNITAILTYLEIASDSPANSTKQALRWLDEFLSSAYMLYQRQLVVCWENTWYYGRRTDGNKKRGNVLAVYADRPSKLNNARPTEGSHPCLHNEWRATGTDTIARCEIVTLTDLPQFDHAQFWDGRIRMYRLPKPTALGRLLAITCGEDANVSGSALRKRAARWKEKYTIDNRFVMHNALRANPKLARHLTAVPFSVWLEAMVSRTRDRP